MGWREDDEPGGHVREDKEPKEPEETRLVCAKQSDGGGGGGGKGGKKLKGCLNPPCKGKIINTSSGATASHAPGGGAVPCSGTVPLVLPWDLLQGYLDHPELPLLLYARRIPIFVTEGWDANQPVQISLSGQGGQQTFSKLANAEGRLDFDLRLDQWELPLGVYRLTLSGPRLDGVAQLRLQIEFVEKDPTPPAPDTRREGPNLLRLDPDHLLIYGFLPGQPFRVNVYQFDPAKPGAEGEFFGSVDFDMPQVGHLIIELDLAGCNANGLCFLAEGEAVVPVIVGLNGAGSLDFFEPDSCS